MTVSFEQIPADILTPGHFVEIDPTGAIEGAGTRPHKALLIGYRRSTGTVAQNIPKLVTKASTADGYFGVGGMLAGMADAFLEVNERTPLWCVAADEPTGVAATGSFGIAVTTALAGTLAFYIGGTRYAVAVAAGASVATIGADLVIAIGLDPSAQVTAVFATPNVNLTYRHKGAEGNDLDLRMNYRSTDATPGGVTITVTPMASGSGAVNLDTTIAALAGTQYDTVVTGVADSANLAKLEAELTDRWGPMEEIDGHLFYGICKNVNDTTSNLGNRNSFQTTAACAQQTPTPPWVVAANTGGLDAAATTDDPARPRKTLWCKNVHPPASTAVWTRAERNNILAAGGATIMPDVAGNMRIERLTTTYVTDSQGAIDPTWRDITTKRTNSYLRWSWDDRITRKYPRHKLADDGTRFDAGQAVVTPSTIRAEAIAWFEENERLGLVENMEQFRQDLVVERNQQDFNRIDAILRPNTINQFLVSATKLQFRL
jgi:phage tail sheath gpL-like